MTWLLLSDSKFNEGQILLRLVPDMFLHEQEAQVIEVTIDAPANGNESLKLLARFQSDYIVSVGLNPHELRVLGEMDVEETVISGSRVCSRNVPYSRAELLDIARSFQRMLQDETSHACRQSAKLHDIKHFVSDLVDRAEKRRALSDKPAAPAESQIAVLNRVLNRLNDA